MVQKADTKTPWINYEVGYVRGRGLVPKIFAFHQVDPPQDFAYPLVGLQILRTGDTNRWRGELRAIGVNVDAAGVTEAFSDLFDKRNPEGQ